MRAYLLRVFILSIMLVYYFANISILSHDFVYAENFGNKNLPLKPWTTNAGYTVHYLGLSSEKKIEGRQTFKFDVTVHGDKDKECYYYWAIPIRVKMHGGLKYSAQVWADSAAARFLSLGFSFIYPPAISKYNSLVSKFNSWSSVAGAITEEQLGAETRSYNNSFTASSYSQGRELDRFGIFIRGRGEQRLTFYLGKLELKGRTFNISDLQKFLKKQWDYYFSKFNFAFNDNSTAEFEQLPAVPDVREKSLSPVGQRFLNELYYDRQRINRFFSEGKEAGSLSEEDLEQLQSLLKSYPSKVEMIRAEIGQPEAKAAFFAFPATKFNRLTGLNLPEGISPLKRLSARGTPGEYISLTFLLQPKRELKNVVMNWSDFASSGRTIKASSLDVSIAKVWYQAGVESTETDKKILTQELLIKNDSLVRVNYEDQTNYLLIKNKSGKKRYVDISTPTEEFPDDAIIEDSKSLLPFSLDGRTNRQIWLTMHIPEDAKPGKYTSRFRVSHSGGELWEFPIEIEVLPFKLDESRIAYSLYYHGALRDWKPRPFNCMDKTPKQLYLELKDMKEHGVLYPNNYQEIKYLEKNIQIRNRAELPRERFYSTLLDWFKGTPQSEPELSALKKRILDFRSIVEKNGYKQLYIYGIDEARGKELLDQRAGWKLAHELGVKIFVAGYYETFQAMGDLLDLAIIQGPLDKEQAHLYHSKGNEIFSYSNPQVGQENPEIYRRNYGIALWLAGYDGAMDYAYQKNYKNMWNDFDYPRYREETFTYPTSDGLISTVQWEGFRQGVNDMRYLSTLLNRIEKLKSKGRNVSALENWVNSIDPSQDLDQLREQIIEKILSLKSI